MYSLDKSGDDDAVDTPLPIPNREVKHCNGEGSFIARIASRRAFSLTGQRKRKTRKIYKKMFDSRNIFAYY